MSSRSPSRRLPVPWTLPHRRSARGTPHPDAHPPEEREILISSARVFSRRPSSPSPSFYDRRPPVLLSVEHGLCEPIDRSQVVVMIENEDHGPAAVRD